MSQSKLPPIPYTLIEALERLFPNQVPEPTDTDREVWMKVGQVRVVRFLRSEFEKQNKNILENPNVR